MDHTSFLKRKKIDLIYIRTYMNVYLTYLMHGGKEYKDS